MGQQDTSLIPDSAVELWLQDFEFWFREALPIISSRGEMFEKRLALMLQDLLVQQHPDELCGEDDARMDWVDWNKVRFFVMNASTRMRWIALYNASLLHPVLYDEKPPKYGETMTVKEWLESVECGGFIDYDGHGNPMKDGLLAKVTISPSRAPLLPPDATHVHWYNR